MQITVLGASGKVGQLVVKEALKRGYVVVAFIHKTNPFTDTTGVHVVQGELTDAYAVTKAITGSDAVISTLGSWGKLRKNVVTLGVQAVLPAMSAIGCTRLITLTGTTAQLVGEHVSLAETFNRVVFKLVAGHILRDGDQHLALLQENDITWTCVRSPIMTNSADQHYRLTDTASWPMATISRQAVAASLLDLAITETHARQAPHIRRS